MIKKNKGSSITNEVWKVLKDYWIILYRVPNVFGRQFLKLWDLIDRLDLVYVQQEFLAQQYLFCNVVRHFRIAWTKFPTLTIKDISHFLLIENERDLWYFKDFKICKLSLFGQFCVDKAFFTTLKIPKLSEWYIWFHIIFTWFGKFKKLQFCLI